MTGKEIFETVSLSLCAIACVLYIIGVVKVSRSGMNSRAWQAMYDCQFRSCKWMSGCAGYCVVALVICFGSLLTIGIIDLIFSYSRERSLLSDFLSVMGMCAFDLMIVSSILNGLIHRFFHQTKVSAKNVGDATEGQLPH